MEEHFNTKHIYTLMNEHSIGSIKKEDIIRKIHCIINFMKRLNSENTLAEIELDSIHNQLLKEQKSTAKIIVSKNNSLSKNLIKSMTAQKENLLQTIEISQLRLEAELKKLNESVGYPALKMESSFFSKLFNLFKTPIKYSKFHKKNDPIHCTREKISQTTNKLNSLEQHKENVAKEFGFIGTESLKYLNKVTYNSLLPAYDTSDSHLENLKNKITILKV